MGIVVVGGQARKVGKTSVVEGILAALPERRWTAVKITQCHHEETDCHCKLRGLAVAISEETDRAADRDSSRYLRAGADRSFWVRVGAGGLADSVPALRCLVDDAENVIFESSSIAEYWKPDVFLCVAGATGEEEKPRWKHLLTLADALIVPDAPAILTPGLPVFIRSDPNVYRELAEFLRSRSDLGKTKAHGFRHAPCSFVL